MKKVFLCGPSLTTEIKNILAEDCSRSAVAFWGRGCESWVTGRHAKIVANLKMGGTNPFALKKVKGDIKQCNRLHAKVFIGSRHAIVASANVSINGLALEGAEVASWLEAGMMTDDLVPIIEWFENVWSNESSKIEDKDWATAEEAWKIRYRAKPTLPSFASFDPNAEILPLIGWCTDGTWTVNEAQLEKKIGVADAAARKRVDDGVELNEEADVKTLSNRWLLLWFKGKRAGTSKGSPWFVETSDLVVRKGFSYDDDGIERDVMLAAEQNSPVPFDTSEKNFVMAFKKLIHHEKYKLLAEDEIPGRPWYLDREKLVRDFWAELKVIYDLQA